MFHLQPYIYVTTKKVSKSGVLLCLPIACGTRSHSTPSPVLSLELSQAGGHATV